ncbi:hypothetical protein D3C81_1315410 [compost metagenome]
MLAIGFIYSLKSTAANVTVRIFKELNVAAMSQLYFISVLVFDFWELEIRIVDHSENMLRSLRKVAYLCQKRFLCFSKNMRFLAFDFLQCKFVIG